ncbi:hypothetical protein KIPE111705_45805 [Kibdelosporangium persicum]|uniref:DUF2746 domain-containing protein n=1 Tax=Kibdelosporangium persicum TaxID=2698649 RepID=A0ABX2F1N6_9PSEU|nr:hypothetical protein [Kibdelosporangium persicum]NRN65215.1 hypothetical protein [Kibdelosporangium persicum]
MEQRAGRRGTVVTLAVAAGVLVAATALFVVLYVREQTEISRVEERIATAEVSIAGGNERITVMKSTVDELDAERARLTTMNAELHACADAAKDSVAAARRANEAAFGAAMGKAFVHCRR